MATVIVALIKGVLFTRAVAKVVSIIMFMEALRAKLSAPIIAVVVEEDYF